MIDIPTPLELVDTAVFGCDLTNQVLRIYEYNEELGKELALAAIVYVMSGGVEISDNPVINAILQGSHSFVTKSHEKWRDKQLDKEEELIQKKKLREIAHLMRQGYKQVEIARELQIAKSTVSDRVKLINDKYSYLLYEIENSDETIDET